VTALAACGDTKQVGTIGYVQGFVGAVAGDEPMAVLAAQDVLSAGGSAADAAVTLYFSLAVTLPSTASLGGGGSCIVVDHQRKGYDVVDFPAPAAVQPGALPVAVPANARGMFSLQAKYGRLRWESLLAAPERMAREGFLVSRALATDLAKAAPLLANDDEARQMFFRADGRVLNEGERATNHQLASLFASLRRSPGDFYTGQLGRQLAAAAQAVGAGLTAEDLRDVRAQLSPGATFDLGSDLAVLPQSRADTAQWGAALVKRKSSERPQAVAERVARGASVPGTGFGIIDSSGGGVACAFTANGLFGTGRVAQGTGMLLAAAPVPGVMPAVPAMVLNPNVQEVRFVGAASGGGDPGAALMSALAAVEDDDKKAADAVAGAAAGLPEAAASRVDAVACLSGSPTAVRCTAASDPKGYGYSIVIGKR